MDPHVPLWTKSNFSFLEGASHPEELIERAHELGITALALTDRDGVHGIPRAHVRAEELGVKLIVGAQVSLQDEEAKVVLLAQDRAGYGNLCQLLSKGRLRCEKGRSAVTRAEVAEHADLLLVRATLVERRPSGALRPRLGQRRRIIVLGDVGPLIVGIHALS